MPGGNIGGSVRSICRDSGEQNGCRLQLVISRFNSSIVHPSTQRAAARSKRFEPRGESGCAPAHMLVKHNDLGGSLWNQ